VITHTFFDETVTESKNSDAFNVEEFDSAEIVVVATGVTGTTPTLVPEIEISGDEADWIHRYTIVDTATQGSLDRLTAPTVEGKIQADGTFGCLLKGNLSKVMRIGLTVGGTNPSFPVVIKGYFR
jgi:hypothetical protein